MLIKCYDSICSLLWVVETDWLVVACNWIDLVDIVIDLRLF